MEVHKPRHHSHHLQTAEDYRKAIASLEASTRTIEFQISTNQRLLDTISHQRPSSRPTPQTKHQTLTTQITSQHDALAQYLAATSISLKKAVAATLITVDDTLSRDDYAFGQIAAGLAATETATTRHGSNHDEEEGEDDDENDSDPQTTTTQLLDALTQTETNTIRTKLERIYLETLHGESSSSPSSPTEALAHVDPSATTLLKSDLRTLYAEIDDVTAMFVAHEHGDVSMRLNGELARWTREVRGRQCALAVGRIREMSGRLRGIEEGVRGVQGHRVVVGRLRGHLDGVVGGNFSEGSGGVHAGAGGGKRKDDGGALVALRGYLGVGGENGGDRAEVVFEDFKRAVDGVLEVQDRQERMLMGRKGRDGDGDGDEDRGENEDEAGGGEYLSRDYGPLLDELDREIAGIKEGIEALPG